MSKDRRLAKIHKKQRRNPLFSCFFSMICAGLHVIFGALLQIEPEFLPAYLAWYAFVTNTVEI